MCLLREHTGQRWTGPTEKSPLPPACRFPPTWQRRAWAHLLGPCHHRRLGCWATSLTALPWLSLRPVAPAPLSRKRRWHLRVGSSYSKSLNWAIKCSMLLGRTLNSIWTWVCFFSEIWHIHVLSPPPTFPFQAMQCRDVRVLCGTWATHHGWHPRQILQRRHPQLYLLGNDND